MLGADREDVERVAIEASYGNTPVISMHSAEEDDLSRAAAIYPSPPTLGAGLAKVFTHFGWEKVAIISSRARTRAGESHAFYATLRALSPSAA